MLTQYIAVREIGSTFFSTELITVATVIMILIGPSIAYFVAFRISNKLLALWGVFSFISLLALPVGVRWLVAYMVRHDVELLAMILVFLIGGLFYSAYFAVFLPRLVVKGGSFTRLYSLELAGAIAALLLIGVSGSWQILLTVFYLAVVLVLHLTLERRLVTIVALLAVALISFFYPSLDALAAQYYFKCYWNQKDPRLLAVEYSPYQRIDVVEEGSNRTLYLDGIPYYDASDLHWFNYYIAELPGRLIEQKKGKALIVGSGSLSSTGYLVRQGFDVTTVDIDKKVAEFGMRYFHHLNRLRSEDFDLRIADARAIVEATPDRTYDLIVLDIPAPFHVQTALLYTPTFFKQLNRCLKNGGIVAVNTCAYDINDPIAASIAKSACLSFDQVTAVTGESLGLTILYCARQLPMTDKELEAQISVDEKHGFKLFSPHALKQLTKDVAPHNEDNLAALLMFAREHLPEVGK